MLFEWNGDSISEMTAIFRAAQSHASHADMERAEVLFLKALKGYGVLLGPTHEDATKVAIAVANFYTEQGHFNDADMVVEDLCQHHIKKLGIKHRRTQQVIVQVVELMSNHDREIDALTFLSRSKELAEADNQVVFRKPNKRSKTRRQGIISRRHAAAPSAKDLDAAQEITAGSVPDQVEYGVQVDHTHVAAKDEGVEAFLKAIVTHCEHHDEFLEIQILRAACELSKIYSQLGQNDSHDSIIWNAISRAEAIIYRQKWDKGSSKSFRTMEALLQLVASALKAGFDFKAAATLTKMGQKAENDFGWDAEITIWAKISIGIVYQRHRSWESAKPWFESARAASFAANGEEDGLTRTLQTAMEEPHYSEPRYSLDFDDVFRPSLLAFRPLE